MNNLLAHGITFVHTKDINALRDAPRHSLIVSNFSTPANQYVGKLYTFLQNFFNKEG